MEKIVTKAFIEKYTNAPAIDIDCLRGSLLAKAIIAYNFLCDLLETEASYLQEGVPINELLAHNIHVEAFRTLIANSLIALIGTGKNDKNSICKEAIKIESGKTFYEKHAVSIVNLKAIRNTVYAHSDLNFEDKTKTLSMAIIKEMLEYISKFLDIVNSPIRPKDSDKDFYLGYNNFEKMFEKTLKKGDNSNEQSEYSCNKL